MAYPDKVNIFIFCHGSNSNGGWLQIGGERLYMLDLSRTITKSFKFGVQVNLVTAACYSGVLLDIIKVDDNSRRVAQVSAPAVAKSWFLARQSNSGNYRGSPFVTAYVKSFMMGYDEAKTQDPSRTLQDYFDHVNSAGISHGITKKGNLVFGHPQA